MASEREHTSNQERELEREMLGLDAQLERARQLIERNSRSEHWGKTPERDWSWRSPDRR